MAGERLKIGVLGLQGAVQEHINQIEAVGQEGVSIKKPEQLKQVDGLIIPGGESTAIRHLMDFYGFMEPIIEFAKSDKPIFGTCAGMVLFAEEVIESKEAHLKLMSIKVRRNAFGRQIDSFETPVKIKGIENPFPAVFIRAPYVEEVGEEVEVLATFEGKIVAVKQANMLACAFHPELTNDNRMMELFVRMVSEEKCSNYA